ncbi:MULTISPECIES: UDP-N-acetylmuramate dehydrogenase [Pontibacillus]|uniref:UDP-N-acetylenolpyruvoylglucosamine reductase n=1 Tax=Pontibacillus chungwhensis TaxID=265426 RepID=A0ABY8V1D4_9BACI|nr:MULTISPECIES: UDP-N-acetylmuramate dehydrogenase [Pontibacillus]MCD5322158.1 UDP-N-acetylmuramate dehydrogenase [Pontibacillus sp. HN14]WIF99453.1 UDP-N-acetylmuramate dehydrogenase [Pontibacillus chungwhensis]
MTKQKWYDDLSTLVKKDNVKKDEPLKTYTFTHTGGEADVLVSPQSNREAGDVLSYCYENEVPVTILGNGSNMIVKDGGIRGVTLFLGKMDDISHSGNKITAQAGAKIIDTSRYALDQTLTGLEFACGIPGTVGGALYMNAGAYGGEVSDVLESAVVVTDKGELLAVRAEELDLGYRTSNIAEKNLLVLEATFALEPGEYDVIKEKMDDLTFKRESKQPLEYPSCGSVFKRPPGYFAGKLIQDSELQGVQIGGVQVSKKHAGFMVNVGGGTATDYVNLIKHVQETVKGKFGVDLETEVKIIGED